MRKNIQLYTMAKSVKTDMTRDKELEKSKAHIIVEIINIWPIQW